MKTTYIKSVNTENTGGDVMVDVVVLKSGRILTITDDSVVIWDNLIDWQNSAQPLDEVYLN